MVCLRHARNLVGKIQKEKSKPTPGPEDSKKESKKEEESTDIPETEKPEPTNEIKKTESTPDKSKSDPPLSEAEKSDKDKKLNKLFWIRFGLAIIAGTAATFIFEDIEGEDRRWASIGFMIIVFIGTIVVAKGMKMQLPSADRKNSYSRIGKLCLHVSIHMDTNLYTRPCWYCNNWYSIPNHLMVLKEEK